jgi:hypothetical protein
MLFGRSVGGAKDERRTRRGMASAAWPGLGSLGSAVVHGASKGPGEPDVPVELTDGEQACIAGKPARR